MIDAGSNKVPGDGLVVLLTGFGPFPGVANNVSAAFAEQLAEAAGKVWPQAIFHSHILPTQWTAGPLQAQELLDTLQPDLVLHFGVSSKASGFQIETTACNSICNSADAADQRADRVVINSEAPGTLHTSLDVQAITAQLRATGVPAEISHDAGAYICNSILFHSLHHATKTNTAMQVGFIHIPDRFMDIRSAIGPDGDLEQSIPSGAPCVRDATPSCLTTEQAVKGGLLIIAACFAHRAFAHPIANLQQVSG